MKVNFKHNSKVMEMFQKAPYFRKNKKTFFRLAKPEEIGQTLITYVKNPNGDGYRKEAEIIIDGTRAIARNNFILGYKENGEPLYNEWTKPLTEIYESYGSGCMESLTHDYQEYSQILPLKLIQLTPEIMTVLGQSGKSELLIDVDWSEQPMIALVGDYLAANGYSISQVDIAMQYEKI